MLSPSGFSCKVIRCCLLRRVEKLHVQVQGIKGPVLNMASNNFLALALNPEIQAWQTLHPCVSMLPASTSCLCTLELCSLPAGTCSVCGVGVPWRRGRHSGLVVIALLSHLHLALILPVSLTAYAAVSAACRQQADGQACAACDRVSLAARQGHR